MSDIGYLIKSDRWTMSDKLYITQLLLGGVGHCFAWHVRVRFGFCFHFNIEELVHSGLCAMQLGHNSIFNFARIKILL